MKRLVVLGAAESGAGTAVLAARKGYEVLVSDNAAIANKYKQILTDEKIKWEEHGHSHRVFEADVVMKSPGIPDGVAVVREINKRKIPVISEIEFAWNYSTSYVIGITGSNGKTTTSLLTNHILKQTGLDVRLAGNIGDSYALMVARDDPEYFVLEISSFQLDGIVKFKPDIAVITNITPDHLDRYMGSFEKYAASKFRIAKNLGSAQYLIYDADDKVIRQGLEKVTSNVQLLPFSLKTENKVGAFLKGENIIINFNSNQDMIPVSTIALEGDHNLKNSMAAALVGKILNIQIPEIRKSLSSFPGVPHRLEKVLKIGNVLYINDSKATNVNAALYALKCMPAPTVWIAGGQDKGNDYRALLPVVREKVKAIICLGIDNEPIIKTFGRVVDLVIETTAMRDAVKIASRLTEAGDRVLLSPACASFDRFKNFQDRGNQFKSAIRDL